MGGISLLLLPGSYCSTLLCFLRQQPPSLSVSSISYQPGPPLPRPAPPGEKHWHFFRLLHLAGHWLFVAVHQGNAWQSGDEKRQGGLPPAWHTKATICSKNFPVGGGGGSLTQSPPVTSAERPSNFANLCLLFVYLHTIFLLPQQFLHTCALLAMSAQLCIFQTLHTLALFTSRYVCSLLRPGGVPKKVTNADVKNLLMA